MKIKWVRIEDGLLMEETDIDPAGRFHPDMHWEKCDADYIVDIKEWGWDGETFTLLSSSQTELTIEEKRQAMVLSNAEAKNRLIDAGMYLSVEQSILDSDNSVNALKIKNMWLNAQEFHRLNPVLIDLCTNTLGLNDQEIDALFTA